MSKNDFTPYLTSIGITKAYLERAIEIINFYESHIVDEIKDIFVCEHIDENGNREYESLYLFNEELIMEAKQFLHKDKDTFDAATYHKSICYWEMTKSNYDFVNEATSESRMNVQFRMLSTIAGELKASQTNCDALKEIYLKYILPNTVDE